MRHSLRMGKCAFGWCVMLNICVVTLKLRILLYKFLMLLASCLPLSTRVTFPFSGEGFAVSGTLNVRIMLQFTVTWKMHSRTINMLCYSQVTRYRFVTMSCLTHRKWGRTVREISRWILVNLEQRAKSCTYKLNLLPFLHFIPPNHSLWETGNSINAYFAKILNIRVNRFI